LAPPVAGQNLDKARAETPRTRRTRLQEVSLPNVTRDAAPSTAPKPGLVFFHSATSGKSRRVEAYLAQVLQRRRNHETFRLYSVAKEQRPDLVEKFKVAELPALVVLEGKAVRGRLDGVSGCRQIERFLAPWLRDPRGE
jgi:thioredoxin-like negative regulator of GroEL